jgi:transposase
MPKKTYHVVLSADERMQLTAIIASGSSSAHRHTHARILLKADRSEDGPGWTDQMIVQALDVGRSTVERVRQAYAQSGLDAALQRKPTSRSYERSLDGVAEAHLVALVCGDPPKGAGRWSLRLVADRLVELGYVETISHETVRKTLKKTNLSLGG